MMPEAGGKYAYARTAFGETTGFTVGVLELVGVRLLLAASKAAVIGVYLTDLFHGGNARLLTALTVAAFLALHLRGVRTGATVQNGITLVKVLVLLAIVTICFGWGGRGAAPPSPAATEGHHPSWRRAGVAGGVVHLLRVGGHREDG